MASESQENSPPCPKFAKFVPEEARDYWTKKLSVDFSALPLQRGEEVLHQLTDQEREVVSGWIEKVNKKAEALGVKQRFLSLQKVRFVDYSFSEEDLKNSGGRGVVVSGDHGAETDGIRIIKPDSVPITNLKVYPAFCHESSHFLWDRVMFPNEKYPDRVIHANIGFDSVSGRIDKPNKFAIWGEPMADFFSLFCVESEVVTPYFEEDCFMVAFLEDYAGRKEITVSDAFKEVWRKNAERDFSWFTGLVKLYSDRPQFVRRLNQIRQKDSSAVEEDLEDVAKEGGFEERFKAARSCSLLKLEGLEGHLVDSRTVKGSKFRL